MSEIFYIGNEANLSIAEKVQKILLALGGLQKVVHPGSLVLIKPNFVAPFPHAVTSFEVLEAVVEAVKQCGGHPIIGESSGFEFDTEATFTILGVYEFARRIDVECVNFDNAEFVETKIGSGHKRTVRIPKLVRDADVLINLPKLKRHSLTRATIGVKNLFGLLDRDSRRRVHSWGLERTIFGLSRAVRSDLVIVDGSIVTERAVYGEQHNLGLLVAGCNVYHVDMHCCQYLNLDYRDVEHIRMALDSSAASDDFNVVDANTKQTTTSKVQSVPIARSNESFTSKARRIGYQLMYTADIPFSKLNRNRSIIPKMHFHFGIRPYLQKARCNDCGECVKICPVDAIRIPERLIVAERCMLVRCLRCVSVCPESAIDVKGLEVTDSLKQTAGTEGNGTERDGRRLSG